MNEYPIVANTQADAARDAATEVAKQGIETDRMFQGIKDGRQMREGTESYLLWEYRRERGESTKCNFGRFHKNYTKSTERKRGI